MINIDNVTAQQIELAKIAMTEFVANHRNQTVFFQKLSTKEEKIVYIMVNTYLYFSATYDFGNKRCIIRAIENALSKARNGFDGFDEPNEFMKFTA